MVKWGFFFCLVVLIEATILELKIGRKKIGGPYKVATIIAKDGTCVTFDKVTRSLCETSKSLCNTIGSVYHLL